MEQHWYTPLLLHLLLKIRKVVNVVAFSYKYQTMMCRCNRATKLYVNPSDIVPTVSKILEPGDMFLSTRSVTAGVMTLYQITSSIGLTDVPCGYWCPAEVLDLNIVEDEVESEKTTNYDDSIDTDDTILIRSETATVYADKSGSGTVPHSLKPGDRIFTDKVIHVNVNGITQTRYRIVNTTGDSSIVGKWLLENFATYNSSETNPSRAPAPMDIIEVNTNAPVNPPTVEEVTEVLEPETSTIDEIDNLSIMRVTNSSSDLRELYDQYGLEYEYGDTESLMSIPIGRMVFVHGMPFQFNYITDRRQGATSRFGATKAGTNGPQKSSGVDMYGRIFARDIAANMPIAVLVPGEPSYLTKAKSSFLGYKGSSNKVKGLWSPFWNDLTDSEYESAFNNLINGTSGDYDYYTIQINMTKYHYFVNALAQNSAKLMGLDKVKFRGKPCTSFDWGKYNAAADQDYNVFEEVVGLSGGISFAYDPLSSISDTISNSTAESSFAGMLSSLTQKAKELQFVTGQAGVGDMFNMSDYEASINSVGISGGLVSRITDFIGNMAKGFNIRFPEVWQDSSHTRSYDIDMHFITPYATAFCKWRYVLVPFFHLFALAAPQAPQNMSVYGRPHIIKAFSKGYFNVELGIIESLTWKRFGDGDMISSDGVPTQIDVSVSFKDMYHVLTMGHTNGVKEIEAFFNNTGLMDMLGTLSGVNMNRITIGERLALYASSAANSFMGLGTNFMRHFHDRTRNLVERYMVGL